MPRPQVRRHGAGLRRGGEVRGGAPDDLRGRVAGEGGVGAVDRDDPPVHGDRGRLRGRLEEVGEALGALAQRRLGRPPRGDSLVGDHEARRAVPVGAGRPEGEPALRLRAVARVLPRVGVAPPGQEVAQARADRARVVVPRPRRRVADGQVIQAAPGARAGEAVRRREAAPGRVDRDDRAGRVEDGDMRRQRVEQHRLVAVARRSVADAAGGAGVLSRLVPVHGASRRC